MSKRPKSLLSELTEEPLETEELEVSSKEPLETEEFQPLPYIVDLGIPFCKKCGLPYSIDLDGNYQCEKKLENCPIVNKNA